MHCNCSIGLLFYLTVDYLKVITLTVDLICYNLSFSLLTFNANTENKYNFSWEYHDLFLPQDRNSTAFSVTKTIMTQYASKNKKLKYLRRKGYNDAIINIITFCQYLLPHTSWHIYQNNFGLSDFRPAWGHVIKSIFWFHGPGVRVVLIYPFALRIIRFRPC